MRYSCSSATYKHTESSQAAIPYLRASLGRFRRIYRNSLQTETYSNKKPLESGQKKQAGSRRNIFLLRRNHRQLANPRPLDRCHGSRHLAITHPIVRLQLYLHIRVVRLGRPDADIFPTASICRPTTCWPLQSPYLPTAHLKPLLHCDLPYTHEPLVLGISAAAVALALIIVGRDNVLLYDASLQEWPRIQTCQ